VNAWPVRSETRRTLTSTGRTSRPSAKFATAAAVYGPDAGELGEVVRPAVRCDVLRGAKEVEAAAVVPEPLPGSDDVRGRCRSERLGGGPTLEPIDVARHDAFHLRLLQHHLGDEDRVRVARVPPRQVAAVRGVPGEQGGLHGAGL